MNESGHVVYLFRIRRLLAIGSGKDSTAERSVIHLVLTLSREILDRVRTLVGRANTQVTRILKHVP